LTLRVRGRSRLMFCGACDTHRAVVSERLTRRITGCERAPENPGSIELGEACRRYPTPVIGGGSGRASAMTARWANDWSGRALTRRYRLARVSVRRPSAWPGRLDIGRSTKSVGRPTTGLRRAHQGEQVGELPGPTTPSGELSSESRLPYSLSAHENQ